ncbi:MAG: hypothetical protein ACC645_18700 [Pirellulales bacterium]
MSLTASKLRENIYKILDSVLETGVPVEIERSGRVLKIVCADDAPRSKLDNLEEHPGFLLCEPEDLVHIDWSGQWKP